MSIGQRAPTSSRRAGSIVVTALVVVGAGLIAIVGFRSLAASPSATSPMTAGTVAHRLYDSLRGDHDDHGHHGGAVGEADGVVRADTTVFDDDSPAVANLDPDLLSALRRAASAAAGDGLKLYVNSGWRSPAYQAQLLDEAVAEYGSREEAARWVATPTTSAHVSGDAIDVGHPEAAAWLADNGAAYGLCRIYGNEPWHFELRPDAVDQGCPPTYADPTSDPRMQP